MGIFVRMEVMIAPEPFCECGCGGVVSFRDGKFSRFIRGHVAKSKTMRAMHSKRMQGNTLFLGRKHSEVTKSNMSKKQKGQNNSVWNGGRSWCSGGYITILCPDHPFADINKRVKEERLVMERVLGRYLLPFEVVHHKDRCKSNNDPSNLQVMTRTEHRKLHSFDRLPGTFHHSIETKMKLSEINKGKKLRDETKRKIGESLRGRSWGKHTTEAKMRMSKAQLGRKDRMETRRKKSESAKIGWVKRRAAQTTNY